MKKSFILIALAAMAMSSCEDIMDGLYDDGEERVAGGVKSEAEVDSMFISSTYGFTSVDKRTGLGSIYVDCTSYTKWTYLNFHDFTYSESEIGEGETVPEQWDIALHRYDAKTNGASVLETGYASLDELVASGAVPEGEYSADTLTDSKIIVDMSHMMEGQIGYAESMYNKTLSSWLDVDLGTMPPIYTPSGKVYVVRLADGTYLGIRMDNFMNAKSVKGNMYFSFIYPLAF